MPAAYNFENIQQLADQIIAEKTGAPPGQKPGQPELTMLPMDSLEDFPEDLHKFRPATPERLEELKESVRENGILNPLLVRPAGEGRYQIIAGHNRRTAARELAYQALPCIIKEGMTDDEAILAKNADNLASRTLLPSERGWAYRQDMEVRKRQGRRSDLTSCQLGTKLRSDELVAQSTGNSARQIQRYIRLTYLIPPLLDMVDGQKLGLIVGEQLSYLRRRSQETVYAYCFQEREKPIRLTEAMAKVLRETEADPDKIIDRELLEELTAKKAKVRFRSLKLEMASLRSYFPVGTPEQVVVQTIHTALAAYFEGKEEHDAAL